MSIDGRSDRVDPLNKSREGAEPHQGERQIPILDLSKRAGKAHA